MSSLVAVQDWVTTQALARDVILVARCCRGNCTWAMNVPQSLAFYRGHYIIESTALLVSGGTHLGLSLVDRALDTNFKAATA